MPRPRRRSKSPGLLTRKRHSELDRTFGNDKVRGLPMHIWRVVFERAANRDGLLGSVELDDMILAYMGERSRLDHDRMLGLAIEEFEANDGAEMTLSGFGELLRSKRETDFSEEWNLLCKKISQQMRPEMKQLSEDYSANLCRANLQALRAAELQQLSNVRRQKEEDRKKQEALRMQGISILLLLLLICLFQDVIISIIWGIVLYVGVPFTLFSVWRKWGGSKNAHV